MDEVNRSLRNLKIEDFIWFLYFFIVIFALVANRLEENYLYTKNIKEKLTGRYINIILLTVAFFIYLYFAITAKDELKLAMQGTDNKRCRIAFERVVTTTVFLIAGIFALYTELDDNSSPIDLAIF